jgi:hypothetical protein
MEGTAQVDGARSQGRSRSRRAGEDRWHVPTPNLIGMALSSVTSCSPQSPQRDRHNAQAIMELMVGSFLLGGAALAGFVFVHRAWPNRIDTIGFRLFPAEWSSR